MEAEKDNRTPAQKNAGAVKAMGRYYGLDSEAPYKVDPDELLIKVNEHQAKVDDLLESVEKFMETTRFGLVAMMPEYELMKKRAEELRKEFG